MANKLFLIGIDNYTIQKKLNCSVKDVIDFKNILLENYDFEEKDVFELHDEKATNFSIQNALNLYARTTNSNDNLLIYFSGHGGYDDRSERGFWIPYDEGTNFTTWISNETIIALLDKIHCKHIFLICDNCFSNSLLLTSSSKSVNDYSKLASRWALTSSFNHAADSEKGSNTLFAETILSYLENANSDFRVSDLIEEVKKAFNINLFQQPQGYPLQLKDHKGGEFVFTLKQISDKRNLKGYIDFITTLQLYKRNSLVNEISTHEDKTKKIGYQLFSEVDNVLKKATFYLYLYDGINQTQTLKHITENHSQIFKDKNLLIFILKDYQHQNLEKRKKNIEDKFKPINIFYIDDFIREQCTPKIIFEDNSKFLSVSNFILPSFNGLSDNITEDEFINNWFSKDSEPILVIKGTGGIGKTTFAQFIADKSISKNPNTTVLFIDSVQIKDSLLRNSRHFDQIKIYNFYEALFDITDSITEKLSEELFRINIDAGNILLIIDGLDEVISKIPNFSVKAFLQSINDSSNVLGGGKVIITCRTHFWDQAEFPDEKFTVIELEPFDIDRTKQFFSKSFSSDEKKIKRALKLADDFKYPSIDNNNVYHPYVLDIVRSIVGLEQDSISTDLSKFSSTILKDKVKNDYIIYRVCDREIKRIGQISVDDQVKFFIYLANEKRGIIKTENFKNEIQEALNKQIDLTNVEAFKSHPFLKNTELYTTFKYDFLGDLFKSIYIASYFDFDSGKTDLTNFFVDLISENCWFGSPINIDIVNRISHWSDGDILLISDIIDQISKNDTIKSDKKRKVIANIFNLCLSINHKYYSNDILNNTNLLKHLFSKSYIQINNLNIININSDQNIRFDFSGLMFNHSFIDNYSSFWECNFDSTTRFIQCHLLNLKSKKNISKLSKEYFIDCTYDKEIESTLQNFQSTTLNKIEKSKIFLNDFLHLFYSNGRLGRQWENKVIKPRYAGINKYNFEYKKTIKILKKHNILNITNELGQDKFAIHDNHSEDVVRFIKDGTISNVLSNIIKDFSE